MTKQSVKEVLEKACKQFDRYCLKYDRRVGLVRLNRINDNIDMWEITFGFSGYDCDNMRCLLAFERILKRLGYINCQLVFRFEELRESFANRIIVIGEPRNA